MSEYKKAIICLGGDLSQKTVDLLGTVVAAQDLYGLPDVDPEAWVEAHGASIIRKKGKAVRDEETWGVSLHGVTARSRSFKYAVYSLRCLLREKAQKFFLAAYNCEVRLMPEEEEKK